jgi:hypothetical protein
MEQQEQQPKFVVAMRRLEAFGIGLVGVVFFSWGTSYFQEQEAACP